MHHGESRLTISSKNYGAWSLRGWLMAQLAGLDFDEKVIPPDDPAMKAEMLLLSSSMLVPCLRHDGVKVWDTLAIGEYLNEIKPKAGPAAGRAAPRARTAARSAARCIRASARCAGAADEHQGAASRASRSGRARRPTSTACWRSGSECLEAYGGPYLFGKQPCIADAMYAPVVTRFLTYDVRRCDKACAAYCKRIMALPAMQEWIAGREAGARGDRRARSGVLDALPTGVRRSSPVGRRHRRTPARRRST